MFIAVEGCGVVIVPALRVAEDATVNALKNALLLAIASPLVASVAGLPLVQWARSGVAAVGGALANHEISAAGMSVGEPHLHAADNHPFQRSVHESATTRSTQVALRPQEFRRALGVAQTSWGTRTPAAMALTIAENCSAALLHKQREQRAKEGFLIVAGSPAIPWYYPSTYITYRRVG